MNMLIMLNPLLAGEVIGRLTLCQPVLLATLGSKPNPGKNSVQKTFRVAVIIATFGSDIWLDQGDWLCSEIQKQTVVPPLVRVHLPHGSLTEARNEGIRIILDDPNWSDTEWVVFLDADDELDPQFTEALLNYDGDGDVLQTAVRGFRDGYDDDEDRPHFVDVLGMAPRIKREWLDPVPVLTKQKYPLLRQNFLSIGSPVRVALLRQIGGFDEWPCLEDWAFFLKAYNNGAEFDELYEAVYWINDDHHRNLVDNADDIARQIRATYGP